ncbi:MAG: DUF262 domain-containing protein [Bacteroidia bacterium]
MMNSALLTLKSVNDLLEYKFSIPSFQRGYKWTKTQVNDLLDDIWEFRQKKDKPDDEFYCLQPIIVSEKNGRYIVIDGQQRLTTICIVLSVLEEVLTIIGKKKFTIEYQTRKDSELFLQQIDYSRREENIDYYYICQAHETIRDWFASKDGTTRINFLNTLIGATENGNNVQVIWYEVDEATNQIDIFTRINMGKISLTPSELIKALFLLKDNFIGDLETKRLRQLEIAGEWDRMEYALRNEEFWYFLNDGATGYANHIEFIFDLISEKGSSHDKDFSFRFFYKRFAEGGMFEEQWEEIKNYFLILQEWFVEREFFHLVGFLIATGVKIEELITESRKKSKREFREFLTRKIKTKLNYQISELSYPDDREQIRTVLLLFNVITLSNNKKSNVRFQFGKFKNEKWDIEHIHSVQSEIPVTSKHQEDWLKEVFSFSDDQDLKSRISQHLKSSKSQINNFEILYNDIVRQYSEKNKLEDINDISNLALLDASTNRGYKNAVFPIKRKTIIIKDANGTFIPLCTKNVFLKYYSNSVDQMTFWGNEDRLAYKTAIIACLTPYLPEQTSNKIDENE